MRNSLPYDEAYSLPDSVRELQQVTRDLTLLGQQPNHRPDTIARSIIASAQNIANSVTRACINTKTVEVHSFVAPVVTAAVAAISNYMELLRIGDDPASNIATVLDWLTVNIRGSRSTAAQVFASTLEVLEGMLQIDDGSAQVIIYPRRAHELECVDPIHDLRTTRWLAAPETFSEFRKVLACLGVIPLGGIREFKELLHLLLTTLTILRRTPNVFEDLLASINQVVHRCLQWLSKPSRKPSGGIHHMLNELVTVVVKLRLVEVISEVAEPADVGLIATSLSKTETPAPSASARVLSGMPINAPAKLYDRDLLVFQIVSAIIKGMVPGLPAARIPICGEAGIGKSAVALAVFHHKRIAAAFHSNRIFISCDELSDIGDFSTALEMKITRQASQDPISAVIAHLKELPATLLVLDGFDSEQLCHTASDFAAMTMIVAALNSLPNLTFMVTLRDITPLGGFPWTFTLPRGLLLRISLEGTEQIFRGFLPNELGLEQRLALNSVVESADCMPLAAVMLGQCVRGAGIVPMELKKRLLSGSPDLSTISRSLRILINALGRTRPEVIPCLSMCSHFPGGLRVDMMFKLLPHRNSAGVLLLLEETGLITRTIEAFRMPRTVRDFVLQEYPLTKEHRSSVLQLYVDALAALDPPAYRLNLVGIQGKPDFFNVGVLLSSVDVPDELLVEAVLAATVHRPAAATSLRDVKKLLSRLMSNSMGSTRKDWVAQCHEAIGYCLAQRRVFVDAQKRYSAAAEIWRAMFNTDAASWCTLRCGQCYFALKRHAEAKVSMNTAHTAFLNQGNRRGSATVLHSLGALCAEDSQWIEAESHYEDAFMLFRTLGRLVEAAESWAALDKLRFAMLRTPRQETIEPTIHPDEISDASDHSGAIEEELEFGTDLWRPAAQLLFAPNLETARPERSPSVGTFDTLYTFESGTDVDFDEGNPGHIQAKQAWLQMEQDAVSISSFNSHML